MNILNGGVCIGKNSILSQIDNTMTYIGVISSYDSVLYHSVLVPSLLTTWVDSCVVLDYDSNVFNLTGGYRIRH